VLTQRKESLTNGQQYKKEQYNMTTNTMYSLTSPEIVERYLSFFRMHGHTELPGSPLAVPGNTTSFIIAGMQPLLPYLRGQLTPPSVRLTALQRCLRTYDADAVGTNSKNNTSFHMLGNWSIGDYGKREAIEMALDLLLNVFVLNQSKLWVTVFSGDSALGIPPDEVAIREWQRAGIPSERIVPLGSEDNLWTMGGPGPCGPCSEIFVDRGENSTCTSPICQPGCPCERFLEVWNLVFMEYERLPEGPLVPLPWHNVDTGMGLERMAAVLQGAESVFEIDMFLPTLTRLAEIASSNQNVQSIRARRMIVDHTRAVLLAGLAGVLPGRDGRGSVVRRLVRRAARQGRVLGITRPFLSELLLPLVQGHGSLLTFEEQQQIPALTQILKDEEKLFERVLTTGLRELAHLKPGPGDLVPGKNLFKLQAEKGFPADLAGEILAERNMRVDWSDYERALEEHRRISRVSAEKHFRFSDSHGEIPVPLD
jgi:alanyl-tRNA synthetase